ncbi:MAG: hypothetical protein C4563_05310 [Desulfobulbus sp.]|jgi:hypothetical protein|nr:MAG: hypothetical protein C4563_05310 [Desulfobulbus sp.]
MRNDGFKKGWFTWVSKSVQPNDLEREYLCREWDAGFTAFSNCERSLREVGGVLGVIKFLTCRAEEQGGPEGFLMEGGLWRKDGDDAYEELAFEREGDNFFVQYMRLDTRQTVNEGQDECYYRSADTFVLGALKVFSGDLSTVEVIVPEYRLRFYIARGE